MYVDKELCIGCNNCVIVCPVNAIKLDNNKALVDEEMCVECSVCYRNSDCPTDAIKRRKLIWPRLVRNPFSDVIATHKLTGVAGRGTEEMKTNDVTNRFKLGEIGVSIEIGRPGLGTSLKNIDLFVKKLDKIGVEFEEASPITALLNKKRNRLNKEIKNERVLSAIIEFKIPIAKLNHILHVIKTIDKKIDTVFSVGMVSRVIEDNQIPIIEILTEKGFDVRPNAKVNVGLGKIPQTGGA